VREKSLSGRQIKLICTLHNIGDMEPMMTSTYDFFWRGSTYELYNS